MKISKINTGKPVRLLLSLFVLMLVPGTTVPGSEGSENPAQAGYFSKMGRNWLRGAKNIVSSPAEIPIEIAKARYGEGKSVVRYSRGLADGSVQFVQRGFSGVWDLMVAFIPSEQEGMPVEPETLF